MKELFLIKNYILFFLLSLMLMSHKSIGFQQVIVSKQYAFKAAFLYRFTEYIEWKDFDQANTFNFAILGKSPITQQMLIIAKEQKVKGKKIVVKEYNNLEEIKSCHILFVSKNSGAPLKNVVTSFSQIPVLIVSEEENENEKDGTHINFIISEDKLKFEINLKTVNEVGIKLSSELLQHAIIVN